MEVAVFVGVGVLVLVAALPLLVNWTAKAVIDPRPFWVHYYDPETIYFYDGLRMAELHAPQALKRRTQSGVRPRLLKALFAP